MIKQAIKTSNQHLLDSRMNYWYHCKHSLYNGWRCLVIAASSFIHAFFPNVLKQHAARRLVRIYLDMKQHAHLRKMIKEEEATSFKKTKKSKKL